MMIPDFAGELPVAVEIAVEARSSKCAVHAGTPFWVVGKRGLDLLLRRGMVGDEASK